MSDASNRAFATIVGVEGVLSMDPNDKGNWTGGRVGVGQLKGTKYGISAKSYPNLDIASLTLPQVQVIFERDFWAKVRGDELPYSLALCMADDAYNHGPDVSIKNLQHALNIDVDGVFGPKTLAAVQVVNTRKLVIEFQTQRALDYARDPNEARYGHTWFRDRVIGMVAEALS